MQKKRRKKFNKKDKKYLYLLFIAVLFIIYTTVFGNNNETIELPNFLINNTTETTVQEITSNSASSNSVAVSNDSSLEIYFFDVGQADSILIKNNNQNMLIDAGNNSDGRLIVSYLKNDLKIEKLDYIVGTHTHEDHIGGLDDVINSLNVEKIYMPFTSNVSTKTYEDVENAIIEKNLSITNPQVGETFSLGDANFEVMFVDNSEPDEKNDSSIVLKLNFGNQKYLFMGDAETKNEEERTWNDVDVLKVGHHGSNTSSSINFLNQVSPEIAIISVGAENSYGLPKEKIIDRLKKIGTEIYRTDLDGTIQIISDGNNQELRKIDISLDGNK